MSHVFLVRYCVLTKCWNYKNMQYSVRKYKKLMLVVKFSNSAVVNGLLSKSAPSGIRLMEVIKRYEYSAL